MSKAERPSVCPFCRERINIGDEIAWSAKGFCCAMCKPKGKARVMDLAGQVRQSPITKAASALLLALVTFATGWITVKTEALVSGRDRRDEDMVQMRKAIDEQREVINEQGQRIAFLEGRNAQREMWSRTARPLAEIHVAPAELKAYQDKK